MLRRLNSLKSHHNKNGNLTGNLYNTTSPIKIKKEFLFTLSKKPLNHLSQWKPNEKQLLESMLTWNAYPLNNGIYLLLY